MYSYHVIMHRGGSNVLTLFIALSSVKTNNFKFFIWFKQHSCLNLPAKIWYWCLYYIILLLYHIIQYCITKFETILYYVIWYNIESCDKIQYCNKWYEIVSYSIKLYHMMWYCIILFILYHIIRFCIACNDNVLFDIIWYCFI